MKTELSLQTTPAVRNTVLKLTFVGTVMVTVIYAALKLCAVALTVLQ